jgi:ribonuclease G
MNKKMLVAYDPHETRIAILDDDRLTEIFIERRHQVSVVGNVYQGRVKRVLPGMQAAFIDIGLDRDAFLYVSEVSDPQDFDAGDFGDDSDDGDEDTAHDDTVHDDTEEDAVPPRRERSIDELLKVGQELMVQVVKDSLANKGARVTTQVTLPGRHLVLLPGEPRAASRRAPPGHLAPHRR